MNEKLKITKIYPLRFWVWEITGKLSEEIFLLGSIECGSIVYLDHYNDSPQSSHHVETPHGKRERRKTPKYLEKSCYHHIKCIVPTFMAAFMWSRPLNSVSWEITTQKKLKKKFDGTNTQMVAWMMNKCRGRMVQRDYIMGNIFHRKGIETERDFRVLLENDKKTKEKKSLLGSGIYQLFCLLFS